jgi:hypothetical protein
MSKLIASEIYISIFGVDRLPVRLLRGEAMAYANPVSKPGSCRVGQKFCFSSIVTLLVFGRPPCGASRRNSNAHRRYCGTSHTEASTAHHDPLARRELSAAS